MHADDILLLATTRTVAIRKLRSLMKYCTDNFIKLQLKKCALLCINTTDAEDNMPIAMNDVVLQCKKEEVYLGSVITNSCKWFHDVEADIRKRQINVVKYFAFLRSNSNAPVDIKIKVLQACTVTSILHNAETWADVKVEWLEVLYRRMMKAIVGVRLTTCTEILYIELDLVSIKTQILMKQWTFWKKIQELEDDNPLSYAIALAKQLGLKEVKHYEKLITTFQSTEEIKNKFIEETKLSIRRKAERGQSKFATYMTVNPTLDKPKIFTHVNHRSDVAMIAGLRMSAHNLQIEMGRRTQTPRENRKCVCGDIEDEEHFILRCNLYGDIRQNFGIDMNLSIPQVLDDEASVEYLKKLYDRRKEMV